MFDPAALSTELYREIEALRLKLRTFSSRVATDCPQFDETEFDTHSAECLDAMREDLTRMITDADDAEAEAAQERDYERYGSDAYQHGTHRLFAGEGV